MEQSQNQRDPLPLVLLVDDNSTIRMMVAQSLQFGGFQPIEAANGQEAVNWMEQAATEQRFASIILLDLAMPGMDGRAFLFWLQSRWIGRYPTPATILITASFIDEKTLALFPAIKHIVPKPFHIHHLLTIVRRWSASGPLSC
jgi:two-component system chemotaxis response regulator CheY